MVEICNKKIKILDTNRKTGYNITNMEKI